MAQKFSTNTPIRLQDVVFKPFWREYERIIEEHGASFAVNMALASHLRKQGHTIPELETPADRIARGQRKRWKSVKAADAETTQKEQIGRDLKRERDRRYRAKRKAAKAETSKSEE